MIHMILRILMLITPTLNPTLQEETRPVPNTHIRTVAMHASPLTNSKGAQPSIDYYIYSILVLHNGAKKNHEIEPTYAEYTMNTFIKILFLTNISKLYSYYFAYLIMGLKNSSKIKITYDSHFN